MTDERDDGVVLIPDGKAGEITDDGDMSLHVENGIVTIALRLEGLQLTEPLAREMMENYGARAVIEMLMRSACAIDYEMVIAWVHDLVTRLEAEEAAEVGSPLMQRAHARSVALAQIAAFDAVEIAELPDATPRVVVSESLIDDLVGAGILMEAELPDAQ